MVSLARGEIFADLGVPPDGWELVVDKVQFTVGIIGFEEPVAFTVLDGENCWSRLATARFFPSMLERN